MRNGRLLRSIVDFEVYTTLPIDPSRQSLRWLTLGIPFRICHWPCSFQIGPHLPAANRDARAANNITNSRSASCDSSTRARVFSAPPALHSMLRMDEDLVTYCPAALLKRSSITAESTSPDWL